MKMKKISSTDIKKLAITAGVTVAVVFCGLAVPALILNRKASVSALPHGEININEVQPYGADTIRNQTDLLNALQAYDHFWETTDSYDPSEETPLRRATLANNYSEIGIISGGDASGEGDEFMYALNQEIGEVFPGGKLPDYYSVFQFDEDFMLLYHDFDKQLYIDSRSGVPLGGYVRFFSSEDYSHDMLPTMVYAIAQLYTRYTGLAFVDDLGVEYESHESDWDHYYCHNIATSDGSFTLYITIDSGWYWTEPEFEGDSWHSTDRYQWDIYFYLYRS